MGSRSVLFADVQQRDETGHIWTLLSEATEPDLVRVGMEIVVGDDEEPFLARVIAITPEDDDHRVHLEALGPLDRAHRPGDPEAVAAQLIHTARLEAHLSRSELAARAGTTTSHITAYERGSRQPSFAVLLRVLAAAGFELRLHLDADAPKTAL